MKKILLFILMFFTCALMAQEPKNTQLFSVTVTVTDPNDNPLMKNGEGANTNSFGDLEVECPSDNSKLVEVYLCGSPQKELKLKIAQVGTKVTIEKVKQANEPDTTSPDFNSKCDYKPQNVTAGDSGWEEIQTVTTAAADEEVAYPFTTKGFYRLILTDAQGNFKPYYFRIFDGNLNPKVDVTHMYCGGQGKIEVSNVPDGYKYAFIKGAGAAQPTFPADYQDSKKFVVNENAPTTYTLFIKSANTTCLYQQDVTVDKKDGFTVNYEKTVGTPCEGAKLKATLTTDVPGEYKYEVLRVDYASNYVVISSKVTSDKTFEYHTGASGNYKLRVTSLESTSCMSESGNQNLQIGTQLSIDVPEVLKPISCSNGLIGLSATGGDGLKYAVWKYVPGPGATKAAINRTNVNQIPEDEKFTWSGINNTLDSFSYGVRDGEQGKYTFVVFDDSGCDPRFSEEVEVTVAENPDFKVFVEPSCANSANGRIEVKTLSNLNNYTFKYSIDGGVSWQSGDGANIFEPVAQGVHNVRVDAEASYIPPLPKKDIEFDFSNATIGAMSQVPDGNKDNIGTLGTHGRNLNYTEIGVIRETSVPFGQNNAAVQNVIPNIPGKGKLKVFDGSFYKDGGATLKTDTHVKNITLYKKQQFLLNKGYDRVTLEYDWYKGPKRFKNGKWQEQYDEVGAFISNGKQMTMYDDKNAPDARAFTTYRGAIFKNDPNPVLQDGAGFNTLPKDNSWHKLKTEFTLVNETKLRIKSFLYVYNNNGSLTKLKETVPYTLTINLNGQESWLKSFDLGILSDYVFTNVKVTWEARDNYDYSCEYDLGDHTVGKVEIEAEKPTPTQGVRCDQPGGGKITFKEPTTAPVPNAQGITGFDYGIKKQGEANYTFTAQKVKTGLEAGTYYVAIRDINKPDCPYEFEGNNEIVINGLTEIPPFQAVSVNTDNCTGKATFTIVPQAGQTIPQNMVLQYILKDPTGNIITTDNVTPNPATLDIKSNSFDVVLQAGVHTVEVSTHPDSTVHGISSTNKNAQNKCVEKVTVNVTSKAFEGSIENHTDENCYLSKDGTIGIKVKNFGGTSQTGGGEFNYIAIDVNDFNENTFDPANLPTGYEWEVGLAANNDVFTITGLEGGKTYKILIKSLACPNAYYVIKKGGSDPANPGQQYIAPKTQVTITRTYEKEPSCIPGQLEANLKLTATGGTPPYRFKIMSNGAPTSTTQTAINKLITDGILGADYWTVANTPDEMIINKLPVGEYIIDVRDSNNCQLCGCTAETTFINGDFEDLILTRDGKPTGASYTRNTTRPRHDNPDNPHTDVSAHTSDWIHSIWAVWRDKTDDTKFNTYSYADLIDMFPAYGFPESGGTSVDTKLDQLSNQLLGEQIVYGGNKWVYNRQYNVPGWSTDEPLKGWIEYYQTKAGIQPHKGTYYAQLNSHYNALLYQSLCTKPGDVITWKVHHRGQNSSSRPDISHVMIGSSLGKLQQQTQFTKEGQTALVDEMATTNVDWKAYQGVYTVPAGQTNTIFGFKAIQSIDSNGNVATSLTGGNFLDDITLKVQRAGCNPLVISVDQPVPVTYDEPEVSSCHTGNDATIRVVAKAESLANKNFQFCKNLIEKTENGVLVQKCGTNDTEWVTPNPADANEHTFTGLTAGDYKIAMKGKNGCLSTVTPVHINEVVAITATSTPVNCNDSGQIVVTATGGDGNYVFEISPALTPVITSANGGTDNVATYTVTKANKDQNYTITVKDKGGNTGFCTSNEIVKKVGEDTAPTVAISNDVPIKCNGGTASFTITITGGKTPYKKVEFTGKTTKQGISDTVYDYSNIGEGTYVFKVTDANDCTAEIEKTITAPTAFTGTPTATPTHISCTQNKGKITFTPPTGGGTTPYKYGYSKGGTTWTWTEQTVVSNLDEGAYKVKAEDANKCPITLAVTEVTIKGIPVIPDANTFTKAFTYKCDGKYDVTVAPPNPLPTTATAGLTYVYTLNDAAGTHNGTGIFTGLTAGANNIVTVTESQGRACPVPVNVDTTAKIFDASLDATKTKHIYCTGDKGQVTIDVTNYGGAYSYTLDGSQAVNVPKNTDLNPPATVQKVIGNLTAGNHTIVVWPTGEASTAVCKKTIPVTINDEADLAIQKPTPVTVVTCDPQKGATISGNATGGLKPYKFYVLKEGDDASDASNWKLLTATMEFEAGTHKIKVVDKHNCEKGPIDFTIADAVIPTFTETHTTCYDPTTKGEITITPTDTAKTYEYSIEEDASGDPVWKNKSNPVTFDNLEPGDYKLRIKDPATGCVSAPTAVKINPQLKIVKTGQTPVVTIDNNGTWDVCNKGKIKFKISGGSGKYSYVISPTTNVEGSTTVTANLPTGTTEIEKEYTITDAGTYGITVTDTENNCTADLLNVIIEKKKLDITGTPTAPQCSGEQGKIAIAITEQGYPADDPADNKPYLDLVITKQGDAQAKYDEKIKIEESGKEYVLDPGTYTVSVSDRTACTVTKEVIVPAVPQLVATAEKTQTYTCDHKAEVTFKVHGGTPPYYYSVDNGVSYFDGTQTTKIKSETTATITVNGKDVVETTAVFTGLDNSDSPLALKVKDKNNCNITVNLTPNTIDPLPVIPTFTPTIEYTCDGKANVTLKDGDDITTKENDFSFTVVGLDRDNDGHADVFDNTIELLDPDTASDKVYKIEIRSKDGRACKKTMSVIVKKDQQFKASVKKSVDVGCKGDNTGSITIEAQNFSQFGGFQYTIDGPDQNASAVVVVNNPDTTKKIENLKAGTYTIKVAPKANTNTTCIIELTKKIGEPLKALDLDIDNLDNLIVDKAHCDKGAVIKPKGKVTDTTTGGTSPYEYVYAPAGTVVTKANFDTFTKDFTNVSTGDHVLAVKDANGCITQKPFTIPEPDPVVFAIESTKCFDGNNGEVTVTITSGNGDYKFNLSSGTDGSDANYDANTNYVQNGSNKYVFSGLKANVEYTVKVKDGFNCVANPESQTFKINPELKVSQPIITHQNCEDGKIVFDLEGGAGNYEYKLADANTPPNVKKGTLIAGTNTITIPTIASTKDKETFTLTIRDRNAFTTTPTPTNYCEVSRADIEVKRFNNLDYQLEILDPLCHDDKGGVKIKIPKATEGVAPYKITINGINGTADPAKTTYLDYVGTELGYQGNVLTINNLDKGEYSITVQDKYGCPQTVIAKEFEIKTPPELKLEFKPRTPDDCSTDKTKTGFEVSGVDPNDFKTDSNGDPLTLQVRVDFNDPTPNPNPNNNQWVDWTSGAHLEYLGYNSGDNVLVSIRVLDKNDNVKCSYGPVPYRVTYKVAGLVAESEVTPSASCSKFHVTIMAYGGTTPYQFAAAGPDGKPTAWVTADADVRPKDDPTTTVNEKTDAFTKTINGTDYTIGANNTYTFKDLVPGLKYRFFVKDASNCIQENSTDIYPTEPKVKIIPTVKNICPGATQSDPISFDVVDTSTAPNVQIDASKTYDWYLFEGEPGVTLPVTWVEKGTFPGNNLTGIQATNNLNEGKYFIVILEQGKSLTDPNDCKWGSSTFDIIKGNVQPITGTATLLKKATCNKPNAKVSVAARGGYGSSYTYTYVTAGQTLPANPTYQAGPTIEALYDPNATDVDIYAKDDNECTNKIATVTLKKDIEPVLNLKVNNCKPKSITLSVITYDSNGQSVTNGIPPFRYSKDNGATFTAATTATSYTFENLEGDKTYDFVVKDANDCKAVRQGRARKNLEYTAVLTKEKDCTPGSTKAQITVTITAGSGSYKYKVTDNANAGTSGAIEVQGSGAVVSSTLGTEIDTADNTFVIKTNDPHTYKIELWDKNLTDADGNICAPVVKTVEVKEKVDPKFTATPTDATCNGSATGTIVITPEEQTDLGGNKIYPKGLVKYTITGANLPAGYANPTRTSTTFDGLPQGNYDITATAESKCTFGPVSVTVGQPNIIEVNNIAVTPFACDTNNNTKEAKLTLTKSEISGGSGNYLRAELYEVTGTAPSYTYTKLGNSKVIDPADASTTTYDFEVAKLQGGKYAIKVFDDKGCSGISSPISVDPFNELKKLTVTQIQANDCDEGEYIKIDYAVDIQTNSQINKVTVNIKGANTGVDYTITEVNLTSSNSTQKTTTLILDENFGVAAGSLPANVTTTTPNPYKGLEEDTYTITLTNVDTGCTMKTTYDVVEDTRDQYQVLVDKVDTHVCDVTTATGSKIKLKPSVNYTGDFKYAIYKTPYTEPTLANPTPGNTVKVAMSSWVNGWQTVENQLPKGNYVVEIWMKDDPSCPISSDPFEIFAPATPLNVTATKEKPSCKGGSNGKIVATVTPNSGYPPYEYALWKNGVKVRPVQGEYQTSNEFLNLEADDTNDYEVRVRDRHECPATATVPLTNPAVVELVKEEVYDYSCDDTKKGGKVVLQATGGTAPYKYILRKGADDITKSGNGGTDVSFEDLEAGTYNVIITDKNGCPGNIVNKTITINPKLKFRLEETKKLDCTGTPKATIKITVTSGSGDGNYEYEVSPAGSGTSISTTAITGNTATFEVASKDTYTVIVKDKEAKNGTSLKGCTVSKPIKIADKIRPEFLAESFSESCVDEDDGYIVITPKAGVKPVQYTITGSGTAAGYTKTQTDLLFRNLKPGDYTVSAVSDTNKCDATPTVTVTVPEVNQITFNVDINPNYQCATGTNVVDGAILTVVKTSITGGKSTNYTSFEFKYDGNKQKGDKNVFKMPDTTGGNVIVTVYDDTGCKGSKTIPVAEFKEIKTVDVTVDKKIDCDTGENISVGITSVPAGGIADMEYTIEHKDGSPVTGQTAKTVATAGGKATFTDLAKGTYVIKARNTVSQCIVKTIHIVKAKPEYTLSITPVKLDVCSAGDNSGRVTFDFSKANPTAYTGAYTYQVKKDGEVIGLGDGSGEGGTPETLGILTPGDYEVIATMTASPFCQATVEFTINKPTTDLSLSVDNQTQPSCVGNSDGSITVSATGGYGSYEFELQKKETNNTWSVAKAYSSDKIFAGLSKGTYKVYVKDISGCPANSGEITLSDPNAVDFTTTVEHNACNNKGGKITIVGSGGTTDYTYILKNKDDNTKQENKTGIFEDLSPANYEIAVMDSHNCTAVKTENVTFYEDFEFTVVKEKKRDCKLNGNAKGVGKITIKPGKGSGTYEYEVLNPGGGTLIPKTAFTQGTGTATDPFTATFDAIVKGEYIVKVYDTMNGTVTAPCAKESKLEFFDPLSPDFTFEVVGITCKGDNDGRIIVTANDNGTLPYTFTLTPPDATFNPDTNSFDGLKPGVNYTIKAVSDSNSCVTEYNKLITDPAKNITIPEPDAVSIDADAVTVVGFTCANNSFNSARINVDKTKVHVDPSRTILRIEYINPKGIIIHKGKDFSQAVSDVAGGEYTVRVFDSKGCSAEAKVDITPYYEIESVKVTPTIVKDCKNNETITVSYTSTKNLITNVTFSIKDQKGTAVQGNTDTNGVAGPNGTTAEFTNLTPGIYKIRVTNNDTGCFKEELYEVISPLDYKIDITTVKPSVCSSVGTEGEISFDLNKDVDYYLDLKNGTKQKILNAKIAYTYEVYEDNGNTDYTDDTSTGIGAGKTGESGTPTSVKGLKEGKYYVKIAMTDKPFCPVISKVFEIVKPKVDFDADVKLELISCQDNASGALVVIAKGGFGNYTYKFEKQDAGAYIVVPSTANKATGLTSGIYKVTVTDGYGCKIERTGIQLRDPVDFNATASVKKQVDCYGSKTASVELTVVEGGQGDPVEYNYALITPGGSITAPQASPIFTGLKAGDYKIVVMSKHGCQKEFPVTVPEGPKINVDVSMVGAISCDTPTVQITVDANGGAPGYEYQVVGETTWQTSNVFNKPAGSYQFVVKDGNGCVSEPSANVVVESPRPLAVTLIDKTDATCNGEANARVKAKASGSTGVYEYELVDGGGVTVKPKQTENVFNDVPAGFYKVVAHSGGCTEETAVFEIKEPKVIETDAPVITHVSCTGLSDGRIEITGAKGGNGEYSYRLTTDDHPDISFPPNKFVQTPIFKDLPAGTYEVTVLDKIGCHLKVSDIIVQEPLPIQVSLVGTVQNQECKGDPLPTFTVSVDGGTPPYKLSLNGENPVTLTGPGNHTFTVEPNRTYVVISTDSRNCRQSNRLVITTSPLQDTGLFAASTFDCDSHKFRIEADVYTKFQGLVTYYLYDDPSVSSVVESNQTGSFVVTPDGKKRYIMADLTSGLSLPCPPVPVEVEVPLVDKYLDFEIVKNFNTITIKPIGGKGPYEVSINGKPFTRNLTFNILENTKLKFVVRDMFGCTTTKPGKDYEYTTIEIPNYFTPDADGVNDTWYPKNVVPYHKLKLTILDRYGRVLAEYKGPNAKGWDGKYKGKELPRGDYWYEIRYKELSGKEKNHMGHFTLYRKD